MSGTGNEDVAEKCLVNNDPPEEVHNELMEEETKHANKDEENPMPTAQEEEEAIKKKYGGFLPKKKPLISKDHERAFFDSADWALGKQQGAQKPKGPLEALRPKLQPTPHQQARSRRSAYAPTDDEDVPNAMSSATEDHDCSRDDEKDTNMVSEDQICLNN